MTAGSARKRSAKPEWQQGIARERIGILVGLAAEEYEEHPERSHRYASLARRIGMRYNVSVPELSCVCKGCHGFMLPGKGGIVRANPRTRSMETRCSRCGRVHRHPYAREKAS